MCARNIRSLTDAEPLSHEACSFPLTLRLPANIASPVRTHLHTPAHSMREQRAWKRDSDRRAFNCVFRLLSFICDVTFVACGRTACRARGFNASEEKSCTHLLFTAILCAPLFIVRLANKNKRIFLLRVVYYTCISQGDYWRLRSECLFLLLRFVVWAMRRTAIILVTMYP